MGVTAFPHGLSSFGVPVIGSGVIPVTNGTYYFVDSVNGSNGNTGKTFADAFATVAYAITYTTASKGDVIIMAPYHTETISTAGGWTPVAGSCIVGCGWGGSTPKITMSTTAATILLSAANVRLNNFRITTGISEVVTCISVSGADCQIDGVNFVEDLTNNYTVISFITTTAGANRLAVVNCIGTTYSACSGTAAFVSIVGGDSLLIANNRFLVQKPNSAAACVVGCISTLTSNITIQNNVLGSLTTGTSLIALSLYAGSTGMVADNRGANLGKTAIAGGFALASAFGFNNYTAHTANKSGLLDPVVDS